MASIRTRLTAWNGGVLICVLCLFAAASYAFLRYATLAQVDRSLQQQVHLIALGAEAQGTAAPGNGFNAFLEDLEVHGIVVTPVPGMTKTLLAAPVRIEEDDERGRQRGDAVGAKPTLDLEHLGAQLASKRDHDAAFTVRSSRGGVRALTEEVTIEGDDFTVVATQPLHEMEELLETARDAALVALPIVVLLALVTGYLLARRALDPIVRMTSEARRIGARTLHERLSVQKPIDELGQLAMTFNDVLERVDSAMEQQRRFTADASHELRTPLALIRAEADVALAGEVTGNEEYRAALGVIRDGSQQLSRIVNDLFLLARADAEQALRAAQPIDLADLVASAVHSMRSLADTAGITLTAQSPPSAPYQGDGELLRRALVNLLDNAIKYSPSPGAVRVLLERDAATFRISVKDEGRGISVDDRAHVFERFYRGDSSRTHSESPNGAGAGLGLAIAREIVELHGGRVELRRSDASGSTFDMILPIRPEVIDRSAS